MEDLLRKLVAFPTVSGDHVAMGRLLDFVETFLGERGMHVSRITKNGFQSLVASTRPASKFNKVMLSAHADVVAADGAMFELQKVDDRYIGRGVLDMKFSIAAYLQIVDELRHELSSYDFCIVITPDEEIGGADGLAAVLDEGYRPAVCLLPDGGENWQIQYASKGYWAFDITAHGRTAHGSRPWLSDNSLVRLMTAFYKMATLFPKPPDPTGNTISLTRIHGGDAMNQIPGQASMTVDIRTVDTAEHQRIYEAVLSICKSDHLEYECVSKSPPITMDLKHRLIKPFVALIKEKTGLEVVGSHAPAASDARYLAPLGIPSIVVYPTGGDLHGPAEWLEAKALLQFKDISLTYIRMMARENQDGSSTSMIARRSTTINVP